jgi:hypothetical protein
VFLAKGCKVPPNSVMRMGAQLSECMAGEYIVKAATINTSNIAQRG